MFDLKNHTYTEVLDFLASIKSAKLSLVAVKVINFMVLIFLKIWKTMNMNYLLSLWITNTSMNLTKISTVIQCHLIRLLLLFKIQDGFLSERIRCP